MKTCQRCNIVTGEDFCPICGSATGGAKRSSRLADNARLASRRGTAAAAAAASSRGGDDDSDDDVPLAELARRRGLGRRRVEWESAAAASATTSTSASAADPGSYALAHTMGRTSMGPMTGDGAYAHWLQGHFAGNLDARGCVHSQMLRYRGPTTQMAAARAYEQFNPIFARQFGEFLQAPALVRTGTVILNWHVRFTGRTNGWSGFGINRDLVGILQGLAAAAGKKLVIVYTVHEETLVEPLLPSPSAVVSLNPDVERGMRRQFPSTVRSGQSRVPGLMRCVHGTSVDRILQYLGLDDVRAAMAQAGPDNPLINPLANTPLRELIASYVGDDISQQSRLIGATLLQCLRTRNRFSTQRTGEGTSLNRVRGVVVFGMVTGRHGLSVEVVRNLCARLDHEGMPRDFRVVIAGKVQDRDLFRELGALARTTPRLLVHGEIDAMDDLVGCRFSISFDPLGFRPNASAMVNSVRSGNILFCRANPDERPQQLIERACAEMRRLHNRAGAAYEGSMLRAVAAQQHLFRETEPFRVGHALDLFFRELASRLPAAMPVAQWNAAHPLAVRRQRRGQASGSRLALTAEPADGSSGQDEDMDSGDE